MWIKYYSHKKILKNILYITYLYKKTLLKTLITVSHLESSHWREQLLLIFKHVQRIYFVIVIQVEF